MGFARPADFLLPVQLEMAGAIDERERSITTLFPSRFLVGRVG